MGFADNLKLIRQEKNMSQEALAEVLGVSRQAVSKWEQGNGYPEVEMLLMLSRELGVSLDHLMSDEITPVEKNKEFQTNRVFPTGNIMIKSFDGKSIVHCQKVLASHVMFRPQSDEPKYWLLGIFHGLLWGEKSSILGWYTDEASIEKELHEIVNAMNQGMPAYEIKYAVKIKHKRLRVKIHKK